MATDKDNLQSSILDRLIDINPELSHEPVQYRLVTISQVKSAVARDLENLLNTKRSLQASDSSFQELNNSLLAYGLRDFTSLNPKSPSVRMQLRLDIEKAISLFESRLRNVSVQFDQLAESERNMRFRISGLLVIDPVSEPVTFDTLYDVNRCEYTISK